MKKIPSRLLFSTLAATLFISFSSPVEAAWIERTNPGIFDWSDIVYVSDGSKIVAVENGVGYLFISSDDGATWSTSTSAGVRNWRAVDASSDGTVIVGAEQNGPIYTSIDGGATWTVASTAGSRFWNDVAVSGDGTKLAAVFGTSGVTGYVLTSTDGGATWATSTAVGQYSSYDITASDDGTIVAVTAHNGPIVTSSNGGATWATSTGAGVRQWNQIDSSADGTSLVAVVGGNNHIYISGNGGVSWATSTNAGARGWLAVTVSADAEFIAAADSDGYIYTSDDGGATWSAAIEAGERPWYGISVTANGAKVAAIDYFGEEGAGGYIYTFSSVIDTAPTVTTGDASLVERTAARLGGTIIAVGSPAPTTRGFTYGTTAAYGATTTESGTFSTGAFLADISNLNCNTTYHFTAYATNDVGTAYGSDTIFTTSACASSGGGGGGGRSRSRSNIATAPTTPAVMATTTLVLPVAPQLVGSTIPITSLSNDEAARQLLIQLILLLLQNRGTVLTNGAVTQASTTVLLVSRLNPVPNSDLEAGMRGPLVRDLKEILIRANRGPRALRLLRIDTGDIFDSFTAMAVAEYQRSVGLPATGYFGPLTRAKLRSEGF